MRIFLSSRFRRHTTRYPPRDGNGLETAAAAQGENLSEFIRKAIAIRIYGEPIGPAVQISFGAQSLYVQSHMVTAARNINNAELFPSEAPGTVAAGFGPA